ncbi:MAG: rRNA maturation RNase YbeY [Candidatus Gracilibacteria bacterium]|nr:rRNA maturation RNase YbeY [Candidatus Gracilibacteria bacterium]
MFKFEIINPPKSFIIKDEIISSIFKEISLIENKDISGILNIVFVSNKEIQELNKKYRKIDKITDVLSFHYYDDFSNLDKEEIAGEIILSEDKIIEQGKEYKLGNELEFYKLLIHSSLHILGYDHESDEDYSIMKEKEDFIWNKIFN